MMRAMTVQRALIVILIAVAVLLILGAVWGIDMFGSGGVEDSGVY